MNARTMVVVVLAVVCGLSAMILVQAIRKPPTGPMVEKVSVIFAATDVKPGETIEESMLEARDIPKTELPEDAVLKPADAIGRAAMTQLDKGDLLREKKLAERGAGRGMAALIRTGMRAITIPTPSVSTSMAGFLLPGNRVDVLLTTSSSGGSGDESGGATTLTLLQNVEILAVHTTVNTPTANKIDPDQARSVTLQVTPEDANRLQLAQSKGTLHLSLRNLKDIKDEKSRPTTLADIQELRAKPAPPPVAPAPEAAKPPTPPVEEVRDLARSIPPGMRAFTITTPTQSRSMVKTIHVGHRVDVLLTVNLGEDKSSLGADDSGGGQGEFRGMSTTLLQDQEVIDIHPSLDSGSNVTGSTEESRAITLLVTPRDAQILDLAESAGKLHLALRPEEVSSESIDEPKPDPVTNADLFGDRKPLDSPFTSVTLQVRTLRGTAAGANSVTYFLRSPPPAEKATSRPRRPPTPSRRAQPNVAQGDSSRAGTSRGVPDRSPVP